MSEQLKPGTLWHRVRQQTQLALDCGALHSIPTEYELVEEEGIKFLVRIVANLTRKDKAKQEQERTSSVTGKDFNPFLPYEEDLFVADISPTHVCLLNKYNVVDHHLLLVTREFAEQDDWLNEKDLEALWACLEQIDGLAFYNGGTIAGASQKHKHLQIVPLPLVPQGEAIPIASALDSAQFTDGIGSVASFPFRHALAKLNPNWVENPLQAAPQILDCYHKLLSAVGLEVQGSKQTGAYNWLATREWMLVIPRSQASFASIGVNSLGFAGTLLVRNVEQMQFLKSKGALEILKQVAQPSKI